MLLKKRYCCQVAAVVGILFLVYHVIGAQSFSALRVSELESQVIEGEKITIDGSIYKKLRKEKDFDFYLKLEHQKEFVYVSMTESSISENLKTGQTVRVTGKALLFEESPNPGNFNQKFYYQKQNIYVKLQDASVELLRQERSVFALLKEQLWKVQQRLTDTIISYMGEKYGGILSAIVLGEDAFADVDVKEILQKSGIGHLLSISGLHISFIGMGFYKIMRRTGIPIGGSAILGGILLTLYVLMTGGSTSAFRAWIMFLLRMGAEITGRNYDGKTALAVAALVVLTKEPVLLFDAGFLLSFGAVLGIYVLAPAGKLPVPLAIQSILFPIQLYYYYEICIYSLLWNLLAIPLSTIVLGSGIVSMAVSQIPFVPEIIPKSIFNLCKLVLWFYERGGTFVLKLPCSRWIIGQPSFWCIGIYYAILIFCLLSRKRKWLMIACVCLMIGTKWPSGNLKITMLNVGQGDSFCIQGAKGSTYLIDGGSSSVSQSGKYRIEPYLKQQGVDTLDYVWVTHGDSDHMNGILELVERKRVGIRIENLILPPEIYWNDNIRELAAAAQKVETKIHVMEQGQLLKEGKMQIRCLWPCPDIEELDENQASIVLSLTYGSFDMLFTGDLEKEAEEKVVTYIEEGQKKHLLPERYEVLKVGHHGSKNSTSEDFLDVVQPTFSLISAGERNRYGHPHAETVERLRNIRSEIFCTMENGMTMIETDGKEGYFFIKQCRQIWIAKCSASRYNT